MFWNCERSPTLQARSPQSLSSKGGRSIVRRSNDDTATTMTTRANDGRRRQQRQEMTRNDNDEVRNSKNRNDNCNKTSISTNGQNTMMHKSTSLLGPSLATHRWFYYVYVHLSTFKYIYVDGLRTSRGHKRTHTHTHTRTCAQTITEHITFANFCGLILCYSAFSVSP